MADTGRDLRMYSQFALESARGRRHEVERGLDVLTSQPYGVDAERVVKGRAALMLLETLVKGLHTLGTWRARSTVADDPVQCKALCVVMYIFETLDGGMLLTKSMDQLWTRLAQTPLWRTLMKTDRAGEFLSDDTQTMLRTYRDPTSAEAIAAVREEMAERGSIGALPSVVGGDLADDWDDDLLARFENLKRPK